jgi:tetratricopeptide (TPR) repeat protein
MNIAYEVYARPKGIVLDVFQRDMESQFPNLWSVIARDPLAVITRMLHNLFEHLWLDARQLVGLPVALAAGVGAWLAARQGTLARMRPLLLVCGLLFLSLVPAPHGERYSLAVLPLWIGLAAALLVSGSFALTLGPARLKLLLVPVLLALSLRDTVALTRRTLDQLPVEVLDAAAQIRDQVRPGDKVFARKPHFAWYAGLTPVAMPLDGSPRRLGHAREAGACALAVLLVARGAAATRVRVAARFDQRHARPHGARRDRALARARLRGRDDFGIEPGWLASDTLSAVHRAKARVQLDPHNAETRVFLAMRAFESGDHDEAQRWIDELLVIGPRDPDILLLAAENRLQLKDPEGALSYYQRADAVKPGTPEVRIGYGWVAAMQGMMRPRRSTGDRSSAPPRIRSRCSA